VPSNEEPVKLKVKVSAFAVWEQTTARASAPRTRDKRFIDLLRYEVGLTME
jgi:hypothetical protein